MVKKLIPALLVVLIAAAIVVKCDDEEEASDVVRSRVLGEDRGVMVSLPESYQRETARRYPVLYVLDGSSQAAPMAESAQNLARAGAMPEVIVVGIPSSTENRARDYTPPYMRADDDGPAGGADRFLQFLERELIPAIDRRYRTTPVRMLAGNSRGGLFVVYSAIERPELFRARFAFSPALWRDDERLVKELARSLRTRPAPAFLYLSLGDGENAKMTRAFRDTAGVLRASAPPALRWHADITRGATHANNAALSTPVALRRYFSPTPPSVPSARVPRGR